LRSSWKNVNGIIEVRLPTAPILVARSASRANTHLVFGFTAALLEGLPIIGLMFTISNRIGAAMWAHGLRSPFLCEFCHNLTTVAPFFTLCRPRKTPTFCCSRTPPQFTLHPFTTTQCFAHYQTRLNIDGHFSPAFTLLISQIPFELHV